MEKKDRVKKELHAIREFCSVAEQFGFDFVEPVSLSAEKRENNNSLILKKVRAVSLRENLKNKDFSLKIFQRNFEKLGEFHGYIGVRGKSLGDAGWQNILVPLNIEPGKAKLVLCDFEHANIGNSVSSWWPADDIFESLVTTAALFQPSEDLHDAVGSYFKGLSNVSKPLAYGVARLFPLRKSIAIGRIKVATKIGLEKKEALRNIITNYQVFSEKCLSHLHLDRSIYRNPNRLKALIGRPLARVLQSEYKVPKLYHDYSRSFEDRDGVIARSICALEEKGLRVGGKILDVGAGTGLVGGTIAHIVPDCKVVLMDKCFDQILYANKRNIRPIYSTVGVMEKLPFDSNVFNYIVLASALRYSSDYKETINEFIRVLKPDGHVILFPTDFSPINNILYRSQKFRNERSVIKAFVANNLFEECNSLKTTVHVRRGFSASILVFKKRENELNKDF